MLKKIALGALAPVAVLGTLALGGAAHAATTPTPTPLSVSLQSCGAGNSASFNANGDVVLVADKTPAAPTDCGTSYNTAGVGYADASVNGVAGTSLPAAAPTFTVTGDTQSDFVFDFELANGDRIWGFANGGWQAFNGATTLAAAGSTYQQAVTAVGATTIKDALFFVSGDAAAPDNNVVVSSMQYANQTLGGGGVVTFPQPANISDVLGTAITPVKMGASSTVSDPAITYVVNPFTPLPNGLTLSPAGVLSGTPTAASGSVVTVTAEDAYGNTASRSFNVIVREHGKPAPKPQPAPFPHLTHGHILNVGYNVAQIGWDYVGYPKGQLQCALTETYGYGFSTGNQPIKFTFVPKGFAMDKNAHVGFTCYNPTKLIDQPSGDVGFWWGLAAHHTYDILVIPATPNRQPITGSPVGWVNIPTR